VIRDYGLAFGIRELGLRIGIRDWGCGIRDSAGLRIGVRDSGFGIRFGVSGVRGQGLGFKLEDYGRGFRLRGLRFRV
jgi:hypothetical protein